MRIESKRRSRLACFCTGSKKLFVAWQSKPRLAQLKLFLDSSLRKTNEFFQIALTRLLLNLGHQLLHPIHFQLSRFSQNSSQHPLERLDEINSTEQQNPATYL